MEEEVNIAKIDRTPIFPRSFTNAATRGICVAALAIEPLYSAFLWQSMAGAADAAIEMFGVAVTPTMKDWIKYIAIPFAVANLASDFLAIDPLREADELTAPSTVRENVTEISKRALGFFIKFLALVTSFPAAASSDALPVANFMGNWAHGKAGEAINYTVLSVVTALGVAYYMMFTNDKIQKHSNEFIETLKNFPEFARNFADNPGKYLEVYFQSVSNACYRGISFAYILGQVGKEIFKLDPTNPYWRGLTIMTGATTFGVTMFSRLLSTRDRFLNPKFDTLTESDLDAVDNFRKEMIFDGVLSLIRGGAVAAVISEFLHVPNWLKYSVSSGIGAPFFAHSLYVRYYAGLYQQAVNLKERAGKPEGRPIVETTVENRNEQTRLILLNVEEVEGLEDVELAPKLFDKIAASYNSPVFNFGIDAVNFTARLTRFVAFFLFVKTINEVFLDNFFSNTAVIALVFLWGAEVFKNDGDLYSEAMKTTCQSMAAKWQLGSARRDSSWCGFFANVGSAVGTSLYDYSLEELTQAQPENSMKSEVLSLHLQNK